MKIGCAKGCGYDVDVPDKVMKEALDLGAPMRFQHDVCPNDADAPTRRFHITTHVWEVPGDGGESLLLAKMGDDVDAPNFELAVESLGQALQKQWKSIVGMAEVIDGDNTGLVALDDEPRCRLASCGYPLNDDLAAVGYCTSEHEREDNEDG